MPDNPVYEYVRALLDSERLGRQVRHHRLIPGAEAVYAEPKRPWPAPIKAMLDRLGIDRLYAHQARAVDLVRSGRNVVIATPTASGKTLCFNLPVMERLLADPDAKALYVYPLKALAQDQLKAFNAMAGLLPDKDRPGMNSIGAAIYDGDTSQHFRKKIRDNPPGVILTNPEMLHLSVLPHHHTWAQVLSNLSFVVIDEVHTYRGVLGSHMAMVLRRLLRLCRSWGAEPSFVFCSATVGNPAELCANLTGLEVEAVTETGAAQSARHMIFLNPHDSPSQAAIQLLRAALSRGLRTIVYARSRRMTELIALWASERSGEYADRISAYRAGFLPEERREIEVRMASGELLAVISTSALELGIDIGGLDLCILVGYPGSIMATWQRSGRVGRSGRESAVVLVAGEDALDQHFMRHPEDFFIRPPERAVLNPHNPVVADRHLICAAAEMSLKASEPFLAGEPALMDRVRRLVDKGQLYELADTGAEPEIVTDRKRPQREVDLRGAGRGLHILDAGPGADGSEIGLIDAYRACRETHPGAVYLHRGATYVIDSLDFETATVRAKRARVNYYTRVRGDKSTEILEIYDRRQIGSTRVFLARLKVTETVIGYEKRAVRGGALLGVIELDMPPNIFETEGLWIEIPGPVRRACEDECLHFMGGIHALEHAAIAVMPLIVLADRDDLGGISTPFHAQAGCAAVFIYDGMPGGAGLSRQGFLFMEDLLETTLKNVKSCECDLGCPSCVHSPKCGSGNRPMDKAGAVFLLERLLSPDGRPRTAEPEVTGISDETTGDDDMDQILLPGTMPEPRFAVLDVETRRSAAEVGGWNRADLMGVSVAVLYESDKGTDKDAFTVFEQDELAAMAARLEKIDLVIGFNIIRFDYAVLGGLVDFPWRDLPTLDLLTSVHERLGYRLKLDNLAQATLDAGKSADGLQALRWWQEGRIKEIADYCTQDVAVTRDLYLHGRDKGHVLFFNKAKQRARLPVDWASFVPPGRHGPG